MTNAAKQIREEIKDFGYNSRRVSVRQDGLGARVEIKDRHVNFGSVEKIAMTHKRVSRCQVTGDILAGGNRFITVEHSSEVKKEIEAEIVEWLATFSEGDQLQYEGERYDLTVVILKDGKAVDTRDGYPEGFEMIAHRIYMISRRIGPFNSPAIVTVTKAQKEVTANAQEDFLAMVGAL